MPESAHSRRLKQQAALAALTECLVPHCAAPPIREIGLCRAHGIDAACHFEPELARRREQHHLEDIAQAAHLEQQAARRAITAGYVYYLRVDDRIKIGYSTDVKQRMRAYPPHAELLAVHPGTRQTEADMHKRFAVLRTAGREWFTRGPALNAHIDDVLRQFGPPAERHIYRFRGNTPTAGDKQVIKTHRSTRARSNHRRTL